MNSRREGIKEFQEQAEAIVVHVRMLQRETENLDDHKILEYINLFKMINTSISDQSKDLYDP